VSNRSDTAVAGAAQRHRRLCCWPSALFATRLKRLERAVQHDLINAGVAASQNSQRAERTFVAAKSPAHDQPVNRNKSKSLGIGASQHIELLP
jgi:hypothetical protein